MRRTGAIIVCLAASAVLADCSLNPQPQPPGAISNSNAGGGSGSDSSNSGASGSSSGSGSSGTFGKRADAGADASSEGLDAAAALDGHEAPSTLADSGIADVNLEGTSPSNEGSIEAAIEGAPVPVDAGTDQVNEAGTSDEVPR